MALQKQPVNINFAEGLDTKSDPFQVIFGRFLRLKNMVFTKAKLLMKRFGFRLLTSLPDTDFSFITTFNGSLVAIGNELQSYTPGASEWTDQGSLQPVSLETLPLIRNNTNQTQCDSVVAPNGLICTVYTDNIPSGGSTAPSYRYVIADSIAGQNIVPPTAIPNAGGAVTNAPRVFLLGTHFILVFGNVIGGTTHLQYIAIPIYNPTSPSANVDISTQFTNFSTLAYDGVVANNTLYLAWNGSDGGGAIRMIMLTSTLSLSSPKIFAGRACTMMSVAADTTQSTPVIWATFYKSTDTTLYSLAVNQNLVTILAPTLIENTLTLSNIATAARNGQLVILYEVVNAYSYDAGIPTHFIGRNTITEAGVVGSGAVFYRGVGLASKAFNAGVDSNIYFLMAYQSSYQPTYFLGDFAGNLVAKLAYSNGGGYLTTGLPSVTVTDDEVAQIAYLVKDLVIPVNKTQGAATSAGVYAQTGINLVTFTFGTDQTTSAEIGSDLHLTGGFLWMYDGFTPVEHGFFLWPDNVEVTTSPAGGSISAQQYFYQVTYEWADNQGNIFRSAPSVPVSITTGGGNTSTNTVHIPTLRLTYKTDNPVKLVVYRWSTAQQIYYQVTSVSVPLYNDTGTDSLTFTDTLADASIAGNSILYTAGGVVENIAAPSFVSVGLYKSRLFGIDAENPNSLWYSKQVVQNTPAEMSDLFTLFVPPTTASQQNTGGLKCVFPMDDKFILFKKSAMYYIVGTGPDNTGANNDFSEPTFITSTVGSANQRSIVFIPRGLMFQSDKGIWLLGRDLSTTYIGAEVEAYNGDTVLSAVNIADQNQVRFTLSSGVTLMYDYYYNQWGTHEGVPAVSSTLYENLHTCIDQYGRVFQENPDSYLDGSNPVLIGITTSWANLAGLQGMQRAYFFHLLGTYFSPHQLQLQIGYDYNPSPSQSVLITPTNTSTTYGSDSLYGGSSVYGGTASLEQWQVFFNRQKCESFQLSIDEIYDSSQGIAAGAGLTLSGLNFTIGVKKSAYALKAANSAG